MSDLTDLEICKRIAEIERFELIHTMDINPIDEFKFIDVPSAKFQCLPNPLTDDALCFRLMVKYAVCYLTLKSCCEGIIVDEDEKDAFVASANNPNRAICLAIIEANK